MVRLRSARLHLFPSSVLLGVVAAICAATPAFADPITITGGSVTLVAGWTGYDPPFGFGLTGNGTSLGGVTFSLPPGLVVNIGEVIDLSDTIGVSADPFRTGPSQQTVNGVTYPGVFLSGTLHIVATPASVTTSGFDTPFTMDGSISLFQPSGFARGDLLFTVPIDGRGTASLGLGSRGGVLLSESTASYSFSAAPADPTPEPATLALLGSGLLLAVGRARRKRR